MDKSVIPGILGMLAKDGRIVMPYVEVVLIEGKAVIRGMVPSEEAREAAGAIGNQVLAGKDVVNRLLVSPPYPMAEADGPTGLE